MCMLMERFSIAMIPTSGSEVVNSRRKETYGHRPIYVGKLQWGAHRECARERTPMPCRKTTGRLVFERCGRYQYDRAGSGVGSESSEHGRGGKQRNGFRASQWVKPTWASCTQVMVSTRPTILRRSVERFYETLLLNRGTSDRTNRVPKQGSVQHDDGVQGEAHALGGRALALLELGPHVFFESLEVSVDLVDPFLSYVVGVAAEEGPEQPFGHVVSFDVRRLVVEEPAGGHVDLGDEDEASRKEGLPLVARKRRWMCCSLTRWALR